MSDAIKMNWFSLCLRSDARMEDMLRDFENPIIKPGAFGLRFLFFTGIRRKPAVHPHPGPLPPGEGAPRT